MIKLFNLRFDKDVESISCANCGYIAEQILRFGEKSEVALCRQCVFTTGRVIDEQR